MVPNFSEDGGADVLAADSGLLAAGARRAILDCTRHRAITGGADRRGPEGTAVARTGGLVTH